MTQITTAWMEREVKRFQSGFYRPVPVSLDYPQSHYVHLSTTETESDHVAYTPSDQYGEADRQVRLKFGRYLKKAFPEMSDAVIQSYVTQFKSAVAQSEKPVTLQFATDVETINRIFETRMNACGSTYDSCMYGKFGGMDVRPYHVYANSPDVAVAYIEHDGAIVSRSVVSTKNKIWVRAYSVASGDNDADCGTLKELLKQAGYSKGELWENRLTKLHTSSVMLPYIDNGGAYVRDDGQYWTVVEDKSDADWQADATNGQASSIVDRCDCCEEYMDDCECCVCECCAERSQHGCEHCSMCEHCEGCQNHGECDCARCTDCNERIEHYRHCSHCECDRCSECNELIDDCACDKCDTCDELIGNCTCEDDEDDDVNAVNTDVPVPVYADIDPLIMSYSDIRTKLNNIYVYLRRRDFGEHGFSYGTPDTEVMAIIRTAFNAVTAEYENNNRRLGA